MLTFSLIFIYFWIVVDKPCDFVVLLHMTGPQLAPHVTF